MKIEENKKRRKKKRNYVQSNYKRFSFTSFLFFIFCVYSCVSFFLLLFRSPRLIFCFPPIEVCLLFVFATFLFLFLQMLLLQPIQYIFISLMLHCGSKKLINHLLKCFFYQYTLVNNILVSKWKISECLIYLIGDCACSSFHMKCAKQSIYPYIYFKNG